MRLFRFALSLLVGFSPVPQPRRSRSPESALTPLRVRESPNGPALETAIIRVESTDGCVVDLVGVIHIAKASYFQQLNAFLRTPSLVLFEMVGGEHLGHPAVPSPRELPNEPEALAPPVLELPPYCDSPELSAALNHGLLHRIYEKSAAALGLAIQTGWIDYSSPNFLHADLDYQGFQQAQKQKKESILSFLFGVNSETKSKNPHSKRQPWKFWSSALHKSPRAFRHLLIRQMDDASGFFTSVDSNSVILGHRNQRCLEIFDAQRAKGHRHIAILYGAAHLPDLLKRLQERGFRFADKIWLEAWD